MIYCSLLRMYIPARQRGGVQQLPNVGVVRFHSCLHLQRVYLHTLEDRQPHVRPVPGHGVLLHRRV